MHAVKVFGHQGNRINGKGIPLSYVVNGFLQRQKLMRYASANASYMSLGISYMSLGTIVEDE